MKRTGAGNKSRVIETAHPFEQLPEGNERLAKIMLAARINDRIRELGLKQQAAAELLSITQPEVSSLGKGKLSGFTFDRLYRCLNALDMEVHISVKKLTGRAKTPAGVHVQL